MAAMAPWATRVMGTNASATTIDGTCTYLVGRGKVKALVDVATGGAEYVERLRAALRATGTERVAAVFLTHWHRDHTDGLRDVIPAVLGVQAVEAAPHTDVTVDLAVARSGGDRVHVYKLPGKHNPDVRFTPLRAGQRFRLPPDASGRGDLTIEAVPTPGHTADHACFWVAEERAAFTGDLVLGSNTSVVFEDLHAHMASLERLAAFEPALLLPGHGEPITDDAAARIRRDLRHRQQREQEVLGAVAATPASASSGGATARDIVDAVYRGYPEPLKRLALGSVVLHLLKLERDGRVGRVAAPDPRRAGRPAPTEDPATYKGPGGLTMLQVHGLLQDSLAKERTGAARSAAAGDNVHPCHVGLDRLYDVRWRATPSSSQRRL